MKKLAILAVVLVATLSAAKVDAQKIAYVDMQELVTGMPEYAQADTALGKYRNDLIGQMQAMQQELQTKASAFVKDSLKMDDAIKEVKRSELRDLQNRISQLQQSSTQQMQTKQNALLQPIIAKAQKAVEAVAKAKGYTYVFNDTGDGSILVVKPTSEDLTAQVKTKLGIK
ncbi:MAG TPA: OmpH family outer membrane protein [Chitinophagaceae bacterium]|jgi:outer membrane protein|nr:OmpH family outer membrane protein [Chitinophagaceae bacterium]